jgi:hypothetical protein
MGHVSSPSSRPTRHWSVYPALGLRILAFLLVTVVVAVLLDAAWWMLLIGAVIVALYAWRLVLGVRALRGVTERDEDPVTTAGGSRPAE